MHILLEVAFNGWDMNFFISIFSLNWVFVVFFLLLSLTFTFMLGKENNLSSAGSECWVLAVLELLFDNRIDENLISCCFSTADGLYTLCLCPIKNKMTPLLVEWGFGLINFLMFSHWAISMFIKVEILGLFATLLAFLLSFRFAFLDIFSFYESVKLRRSKIAYMPRINFTKQNRHKIGVFRN